jgi:glycosyltransferase involved in cell wall biosynthesis
MRIALVRESVEDREVANYVPLDGAGDRVTVVTSRRAGPYPSTGLGLPTTRLWRPADLVRPSSLRRRVGRGLALRVDLERLIGLDGALRHADVVCLNETHIASSAQVCESATTARVVVVSYENIPFRYEDDALFARRKDLVRARADHYVALTPEARAALECEGVPSDRISVQPYGVDVERFHPGARSDARRRSWGAEPDTVVVLSAGRLIQEKGLAIMLEALARIRATPSIRLVLVGDGDERTRLERIARSLRLEDRVRFLGWQGNAAMPEILASADVFAMPSLPTPYWEEQLGFAAIEAMASGLPVVTTRSGSLPWVVGDGGLVVAPYDRAALADALQSLVDDPDVRRTVGEAGLARARSELAISVVAPRLRALLVAG